MTQIKDESYHFRFSDTMLVSILIPCCNAERWIAQCIESALAQTWPEKEVIVVDDGSPDDSRRIVRSFGDRVRWETGPNRGGNAARNRLLDLARGEWVQYLDADDYLLPDKVARQMDSIATNPRTDVVFGPITLEHWSEKETRRELRPIAEPHDPWTLLARWYLPQTGAALWRKQAIVDVGGWNEDQPCCQEHELYLRLLMAGKRFVYCEHSGAVYRQWGEHTVCKRDKPEVRRRRMEIEQRTEDFLRQRNELTTERRWAINQARFEMARIAWHRERREALTIMETIRRSQPGFIPAGDAAPRSYRMVFRALGFRLAETIADLRRHFLPAPQAA
jgi:glycosyltransferase involved in cell wall biosynthesis